jgi:hypothetical protein
MKESGVTNGSNNYCDASCNSLLFCQIIAQMKNLTNQEILLIQDSLLFFEHAMQDTDFSQTEKYYGCTNQYQFEKKVWKLVNKLGVIV